MRVLWALCILVGFVTASEGFGRPFGQPLKHRNPSSCSCTNKKGTGSMYMGIAAPVTVPQFDNTVKFHATSDSQLKRGGDMTVKASVMNLVKNVIGSGVLALPGGVAAYSGSKNAIWVASLITLVIGIISAYTFSLIGRICNSFGAESLDEAWCKSVGPSSSWIPQASSIMKTFVASLTMSIIIGDLGVDIARGLSAPPLLAARPVGLSLITMMVLFPLCLLKDLSALAFSSIIGMFGTLFTAVVFGVRYFDRSYIPGGRFYESLCVSSRGSFGGSAAVNRLTLILISMLSTSFIAHYNAPKFFNELKDRTVLRFNAVVGTSYMATVAFFCTMMAFPFLTFGKASKGFILNNYAGSDMGAFLARVAVLGSIACGFPLIFSPAREGLMKALGMSIENDRQRIPVTVGLLGLITGMAMFLRDLGFVVAFGGAILGNALIYVFPAWMWISKCRKDVRAGKHLYGWRKAEFYVTWSIVIMGIVMGGLGGAMSIANTFFKK